eukprot:1113755_1
MQKRNWNKPRNASKNKMSNWLQSNEKWTKNKRNATDCRHHSMRSNESARKMRSDKEAELQSMAAKFDALSEQHNEMVAAQHEQKTEYESKALESTRLHDGLKDQLNKKKEDLAAINRKYDDVCKENNTRIAALEEDKSALEKRLNEYEATQKDRNAKYELEVLENTAFLNTRLKEELQEKEREYAKSLQKVNDELKHARKRLQEQDEQLVTKQQEMDQKQKEYHPLQASLDAKQRECMQNEERLRSVRTETKQQMERLQQQLKSQHAAFQDERNALERRLNG